MTNIEKIYLIDKNKLSKLFYFTSLIDEAYAVGMLSNQDIEKIQLDSLALLSNKITAYTKGRSSSVAAEVAQTIMESNIYTLGVYLKSFEYGDDAVLALHSQPLSALYTLGLQAIKRKVNAAKCYHLALLPTLLHTPNYAYTETLTHGISGFFKLYEPNFNACQLHITVDYPLCSPIYDLTGIEFIQKYLQSIKAENEFCNCFSSHAIHRLLCGVHQDYSELILNLFEQVLTNALGCTLLGVDVPSLYLSSQNVCQLLSLFEGKSDTETKNILCAAYPVLTEKLPPFSKATNEYGQLALGRISKTISVAIKTKKLNEVFITPR